MTDQICVIASSTFLQRPSILDTKRQHITCKLHPFKLCSAYAPAALTPVKPFLLLLQLQLNFALTTCVYFCLASLGVLVLLFLKTTLVYLEPF